MIRDVLLALGPLSVLAALLYYFGFIRERAFWGYFGVDLGTVGFESTDYILRSPGTIFVPLVLFNVCALLMLFTHHLFLVWITRASRRRKVIATGILGASAVTLLAAGLSSLISEDLAFPVLSPVAFGIGGGLLEYSVVVAGVIRIGSTVLQHSLNARPARYLRRTLVATLVTAAIFEGVADLAHERGIQAAELVSNSLARQTKVVIYSRLRLQLSGSELVSVPLDPNNAAFSYRYNGLRLLLHIQDRWLLVSAGWTPSSGDTVMVIHDSTPDVRFELKH